MNVATLISFGAAVLQLCFGTMFLLVSRAHGWHRGRLFAALAFSAAGYSMINVIFTVESASDHVVRTLGPINYLLGSIHATGWLIYAHSRPEQPWSSLRGRLRALVVVTLGLGVASLIPGAVTAPGMQVITVPWLHSKYHQSNLTAYGDLVGLWLVGVLALAFAQFVRNLRRGVSGARVQVVGFSVFFVCAAVEVLVTNGVINFMYPADIGFLAVIMVVLTETMRRILSDARTLELLSRDLTEQVANRTRERDAATDALAHAERLTAVGLLAAGVGHEINNPLTVVQVNLEQMRDDRGAGRGPDPALLGEALDGVHRISRVVADLRTYAQPESEHREDVKLPSVLRSARKLTSHRLRHVATVQEDLAALAAVRADAVRLGQVFVNLLVNASQSLENNRHATPRIVIRGRMDGPDRVVIEVVDNGVGIAADELPRLSEPYFSSRHGRGSIGLGLYVARNIVHSYDGTLEFESDPGRGTVARVTLPAVGEVIQLADVTPAEPTRPESTSIPIRTDLPLPPPAAVARPKPFRAMIVDDEPIVARSVARQLTSFDVTICCNGEEALELLESDRVFDVILCDLMMPNMSGFELHGRLKTSRPDRLERLLFMTGGAVTAGAETFLADPDVRHILKPFTRVELVGALEELMMTTLPERAAS